MCRINANMTSREATSHAKGWRPRGVFSIYHHIMNIVVMTFTLLVPNLVLQCQTPKLGHADTPLRVSKGLTAETTSQ